MRKALILAAIAILAGIGWWFGSPYWTLHEMRDAAAARDSQKLSSYIDYPAVREDLKAEIRKSVFAEAAKDQDSSGFGQLGSAFALALIGPMVDAAVSPEMLEASFAQPQKPGKQGASKLPKAREDSKIERQNFDTFLVRDKDPKKGALVFKRSGLGWKLSGFDLPENAFSDANKGG